MDDKFDKTVSRFSSLLPDLDALTERIINADLDHTQAIEVQTRADDLVDWAPNVLVWCADKRFLGMRPYAKQAELLLLLFEDFCPRCSDMHYVVDIPTADSIETIMSKVALLEFGVCPSCGFDRSIGRASGIFVDPLEMIAVWGQRSGKCLVGDVEVFDGKSRRRVDSLVGEHFEVVSMNKDHRLSYEKATAFKQDVLKDCVRLTLKDGSSMVLTKDHRVFTPRGWVEAGHLTPTDLVATPRKIPEPSNPLDISDDEVVLAGYLLTDGGVSTSATRFTNVTPAVIEDFVRVATKLGDRNLDPPLPNSKMNYVRAQEAREMLSSGIPAAEVADHFGVSPLVIRDIASLKTFKRKERNHVAHRLMTYTVSGLTWFRDKYGLHGLAKEKRIPASFWSLSNRQIKLLLNRMWACDGYITNNMAGITLASSSMIDDIRFLLKRLGIRSTKHRRVARTGGKEYDAWRLSIFGKDALTFLAEVGPVLGKEEACAKVEGALKSASYRNTTYDVVPVNRRNLKHFNDYLREKTGRKQSNRLREATSVKGVGYLSRESFNEIVVRRFGYDGPHAWWGDNDLVWEKIESIEEQGRHVVYDLSVPETECFVGNNMVVHNSAVAAQAISYLMHKNLMLPVPWKAYSLTPGQVIDFTIVATTVGQADKTLWSTFKGVFTNSHWFKQYKVVCDEEGKKQGVKETVKVGETFLYFEHKGIVIYFAANNPSGLRGTTRIGAAIDELGWFGDAEAGKVRANGPETYSALNNACLTLRGAFDREKKKDPKTNMPVPIVFNISSPRAMNDPIMTVYRERAGDKRVVRRHYETWRVNPTLPKETFARELATTNGVRDFAAQPPITDDPLFPRMHVVSDAFNTPLANEARYKNLLAPTTKGIVDELEVPSGRHTMSYITAGLEPVDSYPTFEELLKLSETDPEAWEALGPMKSLLVDLATKPSWKRPHIMGVDLGTKNNALAVVCGYLSSDRSKFITDFALEVKPSPTRSVNVADVFEKLIVALVERMNVVAVFYDTWQSIHQIQSLSQKFGALGPLNSTTERKRWLRELKERGERPAFLADQYSLTVTDASMLVSRMEQGDCLFPKMEVGIMEMMVNQSISHEKYPYDQLALQMATVRTRGSRLLKPVGGDDDLFRAWANAAVKAFTDEQVVDLLMQDVGGARTFKSKGNMHQKDSHVALSQAGKGLRRSGNLGGGALSGSNSSIGGMPVIVRKSGRGMR